jgi:hypothetical protein
MASAIDPFQRSRWIDEAGLVAIEKAGLVDYLDFKEALLSCQSF